MNRPLSRRSALKAAVAVGAMPNAVRAAQPNAKAPEGYPDRQSYAPGDEVKLHLSSTNCDLEVFRVGAERKSVWKRAGVNSGVHAVPKDASSHGCRWPVAAKVAKTERGCVPAHVGRICAAFSSITEADLLKRFKDGTHLAALSPGGPVLRGDNGYEWINVEETYREVTAAIADIGDRLSGTKSTGRLRGLARAAE